MTDPILIIGGGLAAAKAVEGYRDAGGDAAVTVVAAEAHLPYERPPLSKGTLAGDDPLDSAITHDQAWYDDHGVTVRTGSPVTAIDVAAHTAQAGGETLSWSRLLLATGSRPRSLDVPGADLEGVLSLRTMDESADLRERLVKGGRVVLIGAGWIGLEVAAAARAHDCEVTVIEPQDTPLFGVVGPEVGNWFRQLHEGHGVTFHLGDGVESLSGSGAVSSVRTTSGIDVPAETVVVGVGITPVTDLAEAAGLDVDNGILCDESLRTSAPDVWAAGDVANWVNPTLGQRIRVDHWANALNGGLAAGRSMAGEEVSYGPVPYFFSDQYDIGLEYAGYVPRDTETSLVWRGDRSGNEFMVFWTEGRRVLAGMHVNVWDSIEGIKALVGHEVDTDKLADPDVPLADLAP